MGSTTFVDCIRREPVSAMEAVLTAVRAARGGTSLVVVKTADSRLVGLVRDWARAHGVAGTVQRDRGTFQVRLYLLPAAFGALPAATREARRTSLPELAATA